MSKRTHRWRNRRYNLHQRLREHGDVNEEVTPVRDLESVTGDAFARRLFPDDINEYSSTIGTEMDVDVVINEREIEADSQLQLQTETQPCNHADAVSVRSSTSCTSTLTTAELNSREENGAQVISASKDAVGKEIAMQLAQMSSKHNLSDVCVRDIIRLVHNTQHLSAGEVPKNFYAYQKLLGVSEFKATYHWICPLCKDVTLTSAFKSPYSTRCCDQIIPESSDHFVLLDAQQQATYALQGSIMNFSRHYKKEEELQAKHGFNLENDVLITLNTDGTPVFTSSKSSLWPMLGYINGQSVIQQKQRMMIIGLWISKGSKKPDFTILLQYLVRQLRDLHLQNVKWVDGNKREICSRLFISSMICDSMARPAVQMVNQFNAEFGCGYCYHQETGHYFTHTDVNMRSVDEHNDICDQIAASGRPSYGVLAKSPLTGIPYFDLIYDFPIDVLHTVYLGVTELITSAWFEPKQQTKPYFINEASRNRLDALLLAIKPPNRVSRLPRSLKLLSSYKGHEWNMWLTYYSPILLHQFLPFEYYQHWLNLVNGIALLNCTETKLSEIHIERGGQLLEDFSREVERLYGKTRCRFNVHLLRHLPVFVKRFGPLYRFSMLPFESYNKTLKAYIKGSYGIGLQITKRYLRDVLLNNSTILSMKETRSNSKILNNIEYCKDIVQQNVASLEDVEFWLTTETNGKLLRSKAGSKSRNRCNYYYWTGTNTVVEVAVFLKHDGIKKFVGKEFQVQECEVLVDHVFRIVNERVCFNEARIITEQCLQIVGDNIYFLRFINNVECNAE